MRVTPQLFGKMEKQEKTLIFFSLLDMIGQKNFIENVWTRFIKVPKNKNTTVWLILLF